MKHQEFDTLTAEEKVNYVNKELLTKELKEVAEDMGRSPSWLSIRMKAIGYKHNGTTEQYEEILEGGEGVKREGKKDVVEALLPYLDVLLDLAKDKVGEREEGLDFSIISSLPRNESTIRTVSLPDTIWFKMEALSKQFPMYKKGDLFSLALAQFLEGFTITDEEFVSCKERKRSRNKAVSVAE